MSKKLQRMLQQLVSGMINLKCKCNIYNIYKHVGEYIRVVRTYCKIKKDREQLKEKEMRLASNAIDECAYSMHLNDRFI